ncbi:hypothetical protein [Proteus mirabilis]
MTNPKTYCLWFALFQRYLLKSEHPVYLWLLAFDELIKHYVDL